MSRKMNVDVLVFSFGKFRKFKIMNLVAEKAENNDRTRDWGWTFFRGHDYDYQYDWWLWAGRPPHPFLGSDLWGT